MASDRQGIARSVWSASGLPALWHVGKAGASSPHSKRWRASQQTGIPSSHVRVCATHSHSAPSLMFLRQWGAVSRDYNELVEKRAIAAIRAAQKDLAQADLYLGKERVIGGNHNRTTKTWK